MKGLRLLPTNSFSPPFHQLNFQVFVGKKPLIFKYGKYKKSISTISLPSACEEKTQLCILGHETKTLLCRIHSHWEMGVDECLDLDI